MQAASIELGVKHPASLAEVALVYVQYHELSCAFVQLQRGAQSMQMAFTSWAPQSLLQKELLVTLFTQFVVSDLQAATASCLVSKLLNRT